MKFFKATTPAPGATRFAVAEDVWAARCPAGVVDPGFVGLRIEPDGTLAPVVSAGQVLTVGKANSGALLWWVRTPPWSLRFAPEPELAPEAGLALEIEPFAVGGEYGLLSSWLALQRADVRADAFASLLRQHPMVSTLPPCVTNAMLAKRKVALREYTVGQFGVRVLSVRRVDLPPPDEAPAPPAVLAVPAVSGAVAPAQPAAGNVATTWADMVGMDRRACRRLQAELPLLDRKLRKCWAEQGWSDDMSVYTAQRGIVTRLGLLTGKFGQPVGVEQRFAPGRGPNDAQRHLVAVAALRAEQALGQAWAALEGLQANTAPTAAELAPVAAAVDRLEHEVNRRLRAWWELEA